MKQILILFALIPGLSFGQEFCGSRYDTLAEVFQKVDTVRYKYGENRDYLDTLVKLYMTVYKPNNDTVKERPCVLFVHGGDMASTKYITGRLVSGNRKSFEINRMATALAKRGFVVATIDYRLDHRDSLYSDERAFKALIRAVHDVNGAIRFLKYQWDTLQIDSNRIILGGISTGGLIALTAGYSQSSEFDSLHQVWIGEMGGLSGTTNTYDKDLYLRALFSFSGGILDTAHIQNLDYHLYMNHEIWDTTMSFRTGYFSIGSVGFKINGSGDIKYRMDSLGVNYKIDSFDNFYHPSLNYISRLDPSFAGFTKFLWDELRCDRVSISAADKNNQISFFPNPVKNTLFIETSLRKIRLEITDILGKKIFSYAGAKKEVDISSIPSGVYILNVNEKIFRLTKEL